MSIASNLQSIELRIAATCARSGRRRSDITLVGVSKKHPVSSIEEAIASTDLRHFGENYVQEYCEKRQALGDNHEAVFHFIGHLQRNKVRQLLSYPPALIHSVDSPHLAQTIDRICGELTPERRQSILIELRIGDESTEKTGLSPQDLPQMLETVSACPHLTLRGLMLIPPVEETAENSRPYFKELRCIFDQINKNRAQKLDILSFGMSGDFEVAIEEGATHVRIGTAIFGSRL